MPCRDDLQPIEIDDYGTDGELLFQEQAMTRAGALRSYTIIDTTVDLAIVGGEIRYRR